tara:strand:+ start:274 stop:1008 length:735 start_codon:yes stop_codon:yes gene_type:complete
MILESNDDREWILLSDSEDEEEPDYYSILCVDIGVKHLGLAAMISEKGTYEFREVVGVDLMDITTFPHHGDSEKCCLSHTKTFADWMEHIFVYYDIIFSKVDKILIERQPPGGFVVVEQLIYSRYRDKCELIAPNSVHKFFKIGMYDYDERKEKVEEIARKKINNPSVLVEFESFERKHDMADAICFGIFWLSKRNQEYLEEENIKRLKRMAISTGGRVPVGMDFGEWLKQFEYRPNKRNRIIK